MRRFLLLLGSLCWLLNMSASTEIKLKSSFPAQDAVVASLDHLAFEVDYSEALSANGVSEDEVGLLCAVSKRKKNIKLYEGDPTTGTLLETVYSAQTFAKGNNIAYWELSKTYSLEDGTLKDGQLYTIVLSKDVFLVGTSVSDTYDTTFPETTITFYGGEEEGETINLKSSIPSNGSELNKIGLVTLIFDGEIELASNAEASLYNVSELIKTSNLSLSSDTNVAVVDFDGITCKADDTYRVVIPQDAILLKGTSTTLSMPITLTFTGYELFGYKSISPVSGSVCSQIGKVTIIPDWPEGAAGFVNYSSMYYGDDGPWVFPVNLYQGEDSTGVLVGTYKTDLNNNFTALQVNVTKQLEANTKYALVFPEGLIPAWKDQGTGTYPLLKAYKSEPLTLIYTGANTASKWSIKENDQLEKLGLVSLMTGGEVTVNEGAKMALYCGEDSVAAADINASGKFCYADFDDLTLEQDSVYSLVIPDSAIVNMPKTTQKFKGITKPAEYATVSYKANGITVASEQVLKGSKVSVDMAMPDSIQLDSLMLNGEKVALADSTYAIDSLAADAEIEAALTYIPTPAPETKFYKVDYKVLSVVNDSTMLFTTSSTKVAEDSIFTFKAPELDENWTVEVSAGELADSTYSLTISSDTTVAVTCTFNGDVKYVDETASGVYTFENSQDITISTTLGKIVVEGAKAGDSINLYGLNGAKLGQWIVKQDKQTIDVNSGVYLVVVKGDAGKAAAKVSVK